MMACCFTGPMDEVSTALFSNTITKLEESQSVGVGVNRMDLHPLDKEYSLSLETNRGRHFRTVCVAT